ncbi:MAG: hypothetical protein JSC189_001078 [Candidatus Tokpelaia sp. JSC189]|nr:MAG: hypothetical protein JSC189_001078 [Candidatus Tokpelaia sp. JSC189]
MKRARKKQLLPLIFSDDLEHIDNINISMDISP